MGAQLTMKLENASVTALKVLVGIALLIMTVAVPTGVIWNLATDGTDAVPDEAMAWLFFGGAVWGVLFIWFDALDEERRDELDCRDREDHP